MPRTTPCEPSTQRIQSPLADESECGIGDDDNGRRSPSHTEGIWGNLFNRRLVERLKLVIESVHQRKQFAYQLLGMANLERNFPGCTWRGMATQVATRLKF
nr:hypothetical protein [Nostoc spongiaeforme]